MFEALADLKHWLTPEVLIAAIAAIAAVWTLRFMYFDREVRDHPSINAEFWPDQIKGWYRCCLQIHNRIDSDIGFTRVEVSKPSGFYVAPSKGEFGMGVSEDFGSSIPLTWTVPAGKTAPQMVLFLKPVHVRNLKRLRGVEIAFSVEVHDARRREMRVKTVTNTINWTE